MQRERDLIYQIKVQGKLNEQLSDWLAGLDISHDQVCAEVKISTLSGPIADQAALRGILNKLWDLNLTLLTVARLDAHLSLQAPAQAALTNEEADPNAC
jgi:hypothetical protein